MKSQSDAENHKKSRLIAEKVDCRDLSRQMPKIAICRGKRQLSRFRTHRDKLLPLMFMSTCYFKDWTKEAVSRATTEESWLELHTGASHGVVIVRLQKESTIICTRLR